MQMHAADGTPTSARTGDYGMPVPFASVQQRMCESGAVQVTIDSAAIRSMSAENTDCSLPPQRIALAVRDGGCRWRGCDRPASYCEAHHIDEWHADRGRTDIDRGSCSADTTTCSCIMAAGASLERARASSSCIRPATSHPSPCALAQHSSQPGPVSTHHPDDSAPRHSAGSQRSRRAALPPNGASSSAPPQSRQQPRRADAARCAALVALPHTRPHRPGPPPAAPSQSPTALSQLHRPVPNRTDHPTEPTTPAAPTAQQHRPLQWLCAEPTTRSTRPRGSGHRNLHAVAVG